MLKTCPTCQTVFTDKRNNNKTYCTPKCRNKHDNQKQRRKIYKHAYYLRKIKPTKHLLGHINTTLGTITEKDLDKLINHKDIKEPTTQWNVETCRK